MSASSIAIQNSVQLYGGQSLPSIGAGDVAQLQTEAQAYLDNQTSSEAVNAREASGGAAAASLIANGYNPDNPDDNQKLVAAISGGLCLIPVVGPILGAVVEGMYQFGTLVLAPVVDKIFGYSTVPTCSSSGNWTATQVLANSGVSPIPSGGTLAGLIVPAFGKAYADQMNCKAFNRVPGTVPFGYSIVIAPLLQMWNKNTAGDLIDYFVPRINSYDWPGGNTGFGGFDCTAGPFCLPAQGPYAFAPLSSVPTDIADQWTEGKDWVRIAANAGPLKSAAVAPRVIPLNFHMPDLFPAHAPDSAIFRPSAPSTPSSSGLSTGEKVALFFAIAGGASAAGVGVWAHMTHQGYGQAWSRLWKKSAGKLLRKG